MTYWEDYSLSYVDGFVHRHRDADPEETAEWIDSLDAVVQESGADRGEFLLTKLLDRARQKGLTAPGSISTPYINTIPPEEQPSYPGDLWMEKRIRRFIRWNAAVMVIKANYQEKGIGGHLSTFASSALLYEVGFHHFFRGKENGQTGDAVYIQGHAAPGIYARAFLERRLDAHHLDNFRMEIGGGGLSSYPHPRLMPEFWEYPTVSMGLGPITSIYQARFNKYLQNRDLDDTADTRVWCFIGDGECDEPETLGSLSLAAREGLDNLVWVVNCNLQRLDGPVRGNGKIIQELEAIFRGAGWNVIKVVWGSGWDPLLASDHEGALVDVMHRTLDGEYQRYKAESGAYVREHFFGKDPRTLEMARQLTDRDIWELRRGGHDPLKVYAAYEAATRASGAPTVILAKTIKGWTLGPDVEGRNATHQIKQLTNQQLRQLRDRLELQDEIPDNALEGDVDPPYFRPSVSSPEYQYLLQSRKRLGGYLPDRTVSVRKPLVLPSPETFDVLNQGSGKVEVSTTTAFVRLLRNLCRAPDFGPRVVPIVPDEARTFGMDPLFRELGIYASRGQLYEPVDAAMILAYLERQDGQLLEEGITEAGSLASWTAAATCYASRGVPMVPFFIFYSMFGFQRVGDMIWAAADARARGFLLGATAGRTTLMGEGLQHQDGHSLLLSSTVPSIRSYDPAFAFELGVIIEDGIRRMYQENEDISYYLTVYNENYHHPVKPAGVDGGILAGLYRFAPSPEGVKKGGSILFSGSTVGAALQARDDLAEHFGVGVELWSAPSYQALRTEAMEVERWNLLHPAQRPRQPFITAQLEGAGQVIVAVTDFMRAVPDQITRWVPARYVTLGADGFGRSDTRKALRRFFEIDTGYLVVAVLSALSRQGEVRTSRVTDAADRYQIDPDSAPSWKR